MTDVEKLIKEAKEEGVDLSECSAEELKELAEEIYGQLSEDSPEITKEQLMEADYLALCFAKRASQDDSYGLKEFVEEFCPDLD